MRTEEAIELMRKVPLYRELLYYTYLDEDVQAAAQRFAHSEEFAEVVRLLGERVKGSTILDLGAGNGIATYAFLQFGARQVIALEPDPSDIIGYGAIRSIVSDEQVSIVGSFGEHLPFASASIDIVYARQVLHHTSDLDLVLRECARVLKKGGGFIACREHVIDDDAQLQSFLANHQVHQFTGGENAFRLEQYRNAIQNGGLTVTRELAPFDSIINTYPMLATQREVEQLAADKLRRRFGTLGGVIARIPGVAIVVKDAIARRNRYPGRLYSFVATK
jgi:SAM-dependent methyltransferase